MGWKGFNNSIGSTVALHDLSGREPLHGVERRHNCPQVGGVIIISKPLEGHLRCQTWVTATTVNTLRDSHMAPQVNFPHVYSPPRDTSTVLQMISEYNSQLQWFPEEPSRGWMQTVIQLLGKINTPRATWSGGPTKGTRVSHPTFRHFQDWGMNSESGGLHTEKDVSKLWGKKLEGEKSKAWLKVVSHSCEAPRWDKGMDFVGKHSQILWKKSLKSQPSQRCMAPTNPRWG